MVGVFGFFGSGNKWLARGLTIALTGENKFRDEPFPVAPYKRWTKNRNEADWVSCTKFVNSITPEQWPVVKDHFCIDLYLRRFAEIGVPCIYLQRRTLGNVQYLLQWKSVEGWLWYQESIIRENADLASHLWPEVPPDYTPATLAVAHAIQSWKDRQVAKECGAIIAVGEEAFAEYSVWWPWLFRKLSITPNKNWFQWIGENRTTPFYPIMEDQHLIDVVTEVEERAAIYCK